MRTISWQLLHRYLMTRDWPSTSRRRMTFLQCGQRTTTLTFLQASAVGARVRLAASARG